MCCILSFKQPMLSSNQNMAADTAAKTDEKLIHKIGNILAA